MSTGFWVPELQFHANSGLPLLLMPLNLGIKLSMLTWSYSFSPCVAFADDSSELPVSWYQTQALALWRLCSVILGYGCL